MEEKTKKTGYEWCLEANLSILDISKWVTISKDPKIDWLQEWSFYNEKITAKVFYDYLSKCDVKPNSQHLKSLIFLEYRMYGMVPYNLSPIQQGIQFGHAVVDYGEQSRNTIIEHIYRKWAKEDKTFIILNGGTTNNNPERLGTLNQHYETLIANEISVQDFYEPDLGDQLTAICFLVDERVFNKEIYKDFVSDPKPWGNDKASEKVISIWEAQNTKNYNAWVEKIGGTRHAFLREYLKTLRLA